MGRERPLHRVLGLAAQIRRLWKRIGKNCQWGHPRAPLVRWLRAEDATEAVLEFLGDTRVGCRTASRTIRPRGQEGQESEGEEGGPGPP